MTQNVYRSAPYSEYWNNYHAGKKIQILYNYCIFAINIFEIFCKIYILELIGIDEEIGISISYPNL